MLTGVIAGKIQSMQKREVCDKTNRNKLVINYMQSFISLVPTLCTLEGGARILHCTNRGDGKGKIFVCKITVLLKVIGLFGNEN